MSSPGTSGTDFSRLPVIDFSLASSPSTKPLFLSQLRHALIHVGFLYLSNHPVPASIIDSYVSYIPKLFLLPHEEKDKNSMRNSPHFHGYVGLSTEFEPGFLKPNNRESFDFATRCETKWREGGEEEGIKDYWRIFGPAQWPDESLIPGFQEAAEQYLDKVTELSYAFVSLVAEALGLPPNGFTNFFDKPGEMQHRVRTLKYPVLAGFDVDDLGTVPHQDVGFVSILLQPSPHSVLQVESPSLKTWLDVPPIPGTFVVNIGRALEYVTQNILRATTHRVLSPRPGPGQLSTPRYSVAFFQNIGLDVKLADSVLQLPPEILALKDERVKPTSLSAMNYATEPAGLVRLISKVVIYPEIGKKYYPAIYEKYCGK